MFICILTHTHTTPTTPTPEAGSTCRKPKFILDCWKTAGGDDDIQGSEAGKEGCMGEELRKDNWERTLYYPALPAVLSTA